MSLKDAEGLTPEIKLSTIINSLAPANVKTQRLIVLSPSYMNTLSAILSETSHEVLQTYFVWKIVQAYYSVIEADELKPYARFSNELQGKVTSLSVKFQLRKTNKYRILIRVQNVGEFALTMLMTVWDGFLVDSLLRMHFPQRLKCSVIKLCPTLRTHLSKN